MTIQIGVKNLDSRENAVVCVKVQTRDGQPVPGNPDSELRGGEETSKYVVNGLRILVEEVRNG